VFSHALMEHLFDPLRAIGEMHRVLMLGGVAGLCSPDWGDLSSLLLRRNCLWPSTLIYKAASKKWRGCPRGPKTWPAPSPGRLLRYLNVRAL
jgi:hypothetical protein